MDTHLQDLCEAIEGLSADYRWHFDGCEATVDVALFMPTKTLCNEHRINPELLRRLGDAGVELAISVYVSLDSEAE